ncbi:MAG: F0F1 ATP synthase subunit epsilon [Muribaculaceae bacterium]|nr:F0F1 ATP synthase subunit epsilon [Muribaculaceae bacterium]
MGEAFTLRVISPSKVVFEGEVEMVGLPGTGGAFTVLHNHASLITTLEKGRIVYRVKGEHGDDRVIEISGGLATVDHNVVSVCLE